MQLELSTPALLFPAISLLLLAYTSRFLTIANLIRSLHAQYRKDQQAVIAGQIANLRKRVTLIKKMQIWGVASLLLCVVCMFLLFVNYYVLGAIIFGISLILLAISLFQSILEILISTEALKLELSDMESNTHKSP